jgi:hypothetical protein
MASGLGTVTIDFGAFPGSNEASITFADAAVQATSAVEAYVMGGDTTGDHTAADHRYFAMLCALSAEPTAGVGGNIHARSEHKLQGTFKVRYVWAD